MKSFIEYLTESRKQYKLTIKLSFKPEDKLIDAIEKTLGRFDLDSISRAKSLPIKKLDPHFPKMSSPETYAIDVVLNYPATTEMIKNTLLQVGLSLEHVCVIGTNHYNSFEKDEENREKNTSDAPLLLRDLEPGLSDIKVAELSGDEYNKKLVKNSMTKRPKIKGAPPTADTTNNYPTGDKSPVGSTKNKLPKVVSSAR